MKNRNHGLNEKEMELVQLLMADCESTGDIQAKLRQSRTKTALRLCVRLACIFSVILHQISLKYESIPASI